MNYNVKHITNNAEILTTECKRVSTALKRFATFLNEYDRCYNDMLSEITSTTNNTTTFTDDRYNTITMTLTANDNYDKYTLTIKHTHNAPETIWSICTPDGTIKDFTNRKELFEYAYNNNLYGSFDNIWIEEKELKDDRFDYYETVDYEELDLYKIRTCIELDICDIKANKDTNDTNKDTTETTETSNPKTTEETNTTNEPETTDNTTEETTDNTPEETTEETTKTYDIIPFKTALNIGYRSFKQDVDNMTAPYIKGCKSYHELNIANVTIEEFGDYIQKNVLSYFKNNQCDFTWNECVLRSYYMKYIAKIILFKRDFENIIRIWNCKHIYITTFMKYAESKKGINKSYNIDEFLRVVIKK